MTNHPPQADREKQPNSRMCFVCGLQNDAGLHVKFYTETPGKVRVDWTAPENYQGYPGHLHGGISAAILDEVAGRTVLGATAFRFFVTMKMELRYRKPVPIGVPLVIRGSAKRYFPSRRIGRGRGRGAGGRGAPPNGGSNGPGPNRLAGLSGLKSCLPVLGRHAGIARYVSVCIGPGSRLNPRRDDGQIVIPCVLFRHSVIGIVDPI
jgi:acyl-coenzyme A thioesterase PaaI-like protein